MGIFQIVDLQAYGPSGDWLLGLLIQTIVMIPLLAGVNSQLHLPGLWSAVWDVSILATSRPRLLQARPSLDPRPFWPREEGSGE